MRVILAFLLTFSTTSVLAETVVATRTIRPQEILQPGDLRMDPTVVQGAYSSLGQVLGLEARVALYPGRAIMPVQLGPPALVDRNQIVELVFSQGGLRIIAEGRALGRGGVGERIRVMNSASRTVLFGTVSPSGSVLISK